MQEAIRVLIVEDDPLFTKLITSMLLTKHFSVRGAPSAEEGIEALQSHTFDIVITDLNMEGIGGTGLIRWIMAEGRVPIERILVITGESQNSEDSGWVLGRNITILRKPFGLRTLLETVEAMARG